MECGICVLRSRVGIQGWSSHTNCNPAGGITDTPPTSRSRLRAYPGGRALSEFGNTSAKLQVAKSPAYV
jgi:hypothetical protein